MLFEKYCIGICNMIILRFILGIFPVIFLRVKHDFHPIFSLQNENPSRKKEKKVFGNSPYLERIDIKWIRKEKQEYRKNSLIYRVPQKAFLLAWGGIAVGRPDFWVVCPSLIFFTTRCFAHFQHYKERLLHGPEASAVLILPISLPLISFSSSWLSWCSKLLNSFVFPMAIPSLRNFLWPPSCEWKNLRLLCPTKHSCVQQEG